MEKKKNLNASDIDEELEIVDDDDSNSNKKDELHNESLLGDTVELNLDFNNLFVNDNIDVSRVESISDGLNYSLDKLGSVDIEYISKITNRSKEEVLEELKDSIFQNPESFDGDSFSNYITADEYLSGNLREKYKKAVEANELYKGYFQKNVDAIKKLIKEDSYLDDDIVVTLGTPWLPPEIIDEFISYLLEIPIKKLFASEWWYSSSDYNYTCHDAVTGTWQCNVKKSWVVKTSSFANFYYGTEKMNAVEIIEKTLNIKAILAYKKKRNSKGEKVKVVNNKETALLLHKQELIIKAFEKWIFADSKRKMDLIDIYNKKYTNIIFRKYDGSFLTFPMMNKNVQLYPHQKNAIFRILHTPNTLLAHNVGSGKTYILIASGMEMRRLKFANKIMYVIPNNIISQWEQLFKYLYPTANFFTISNNNFKVAERNNTLSHIKNTDYDAILITYSCFDLISISNAAKISLILDEIEEIDNILDEGDNTSTTKLENLRKRLSKEIDELSEKKDDPNTIYFDQLGIDRLFVDEAHNYKNVNLKSKINSVLGLNLHGSTKSNNMLSKIKLIQKNNYGKGIVFATGTPITNSICEAYTMQNYLQRGELRLADISNFDDWVNLFAKNSPEFEVDVDTKKYRMATRFSKFYNLSILTRILSSVCDFHYSHVFTNLPKFNGYTNVIIEKTKEFNDFLNSISDRADKIRNKEVSRVEDNMLKVTVDGRKAALDMRLFDSSAKFTTNSKVYQCAQIVSKIYHDKSDDKLTQLIFCDSSVPNSNKNKFNIYDEMKRLLISMNVKDSDIAFVHDADTPSKRDRLFAAFNDGKIRILIGSTFKLGIGVNVQKKLYALHHLDIPWRPADMEQREGRILRQGNTNEEIFIYRYITKGSFDAYSYQLLESKQKFITDLLSNSLKSQDSDDVSDTVLTYSEVKALAIGNPLIKKRVEISNQITKLKMLSQKEDEQKNRLNNEYSSLPSRIENMKNVISKVKDDFTFYSNDTFKYKADEKKQLRQTIFNALKRRIFKTEEKEIATYKGFKVIAPTNMSYQNFHLILERESRYNVAINRDEEISVLRRIDFALEDLKNTISKYEADLKVLTDKKAFIEIELSRPNKYVSTLESLSKELEEIDKKLDVKGSENE